MKNIYLFLLKRTNDTTLGFAIGLLGGWLINMLTAPLENDFFRWAAGYLGISVLANFALQLLSGILKHRLERDIRRNEEIKAQNLTSEKKDQKKVFTDKELEKNAFCYKPWWEYAYFGSLAIWIGALVLCFVMTLKGNTFSEYEKKEKDAIIEAQRKDQMDKIRAIERLLIQQQTEMPKSPTPPNLEKPPPNGKN